MDVQEMIEAALNEGIIETREVALCQDLSADELTDFLGECRRIASVKPRKAPFMPKFSLGQTVATPGALALMTKHGVSALELLERHQNGDWGDCGAEDAATNDEAVSGEGKLDADGSPMWTGRVLSVYKVGAAKVWIITEWDRSVTTVLLPEDY